MLSLLLIPLLTQALLIHESNCVEASCIEHLRDYLKQLSPRFQSDKEVVGDKEGNKYLTTITQSKPPLSMPSLYVNVYTVTSEVIEVTDLTGNRVGNSFKIYIRLSEADINNPLKCLYIGIDSTHINRECTFFIEYTDLKQSDPIKFYMYRMVVKIPYVPGHDYYLNGFLIDQKVDNNQIVENPRYNVKLYKGQSCKEEMLPGATLYYGDKICIGVFGNDIITLLSYLEVHSLSLTYTSNSRDQTIDMLGVTVIRRSLDGTNKKGQVYVILPIMYVGKTRISMAIVSQRMTVLSDGLVYKQLPLAEEVHIELPEVPVIAGYDPSPEFEKHPEEDEEEDEDEDEEDSASSIIVSLITFLCLLVVIF